MIEFLTVTLILAFFSLLSLQKKSLDLQGIITGLIIGFLTYLLGRAFLHDGLTYFLTLIFFFIAAEASTRLARNIKEIKPHEVRTTGNILGNAGAAIMC